MAYRTQFLLGGVALLTLAAGTLVYIGARPAGSAWLLPAALNSIVELPWLAGRVGQSLPSLVHALAFSLLTGLCLHPWRYAAIVACAGWLAVDTLFELAQHPMIAEALAARLPATFANWPVLNHVAAYLVNGRMDVMDLIFVALGCALAYGLLRRTTRS